MKMISKIGISLATAALLFVGCGEGPVAPKAVEVASKAETKAYGGLYLTQEKDLGYRQASLYNEKDDGVKSSTYNKAAPGESQRIQRAFQDAPPMIPHDTDGILEITRDNNQCLQCHTPEVAESMGALPVPASHFLNMRPVNKIVNGKLVNGVDNLKNQVSVKKMTDVYGGRFNCVQCHAPQSNAELITENRFQPVYLNDDGAFRSHWSDRVEKNLDTVGKDSSVTQKDIANKDSAAGKLEH
jgi:nitrate reductase (cytochrome), electron transfer subunit